jgi:predicted helicase
MSSLQKILNNFRASAVTEREKGTYFEQLVKAYLLQEPSYKDLFAGQVYLWEEWRKHQMQQGQSDPGVDAGIDLVAVEATADSPRVFAVQAKFYAEDATISKAAGIDSFLSAMGKAPFTNGLLVLTTYKATEHVINLVQGRDKPVNIIDINALESSAIDWGQYQPEASTKTKPLPPP